ncbi:MAG: VCBS repeat-containing protein [Magnetococcales bacterium]|nr:VCBS repeat-containing protein [Magnetococcales bacterium]
MATTSVSFATKVDYATGYNPRSVTSSDVNGDGYLDILVASGSSTVSVFINNGNGSFANKIDYATGSSPFSVTSTDVNSDGYQDILVANAGSHTVSVLLNNGNGSFANKIDYATGSYPWSVTSSDVNGDGKQDILVANWFSHTVSVLLNNGNGSFANKIDYATGSYPQSVTSTDVNGDGKQDILVANDGSNTVSVLLNNGNGSFANKIDYATGSNPESVTSTDVNGDGKQDILVANAGSHTVSVLLNNGNGSFANKIDYATGSNPRSVTSTDVNGDGYQDILTANDGSNTVSVLLNNGNGSFATKIDYAVGSWPEWVTSTDVNGDGYRDILVANANSHTVSVLLNTTSISATTPAVPTSLDLAAADDTGTSNSDNITSQTSSLTISGSSGEAAATLVLFDDKDNDGVVDSGEALVTTSVTAATWSADISLAVGTHNIRAVQSNSAGSSAASAALAITVTAPYVAPTLAISATNANRDEGNSGSTGFVFTVTRSGDLSLTSSASWAVGSGGIAAASDFYGGSLPSGTVSFAANESSKTVTVDVAGDTTVESDESFTVTLSNPSNGTLGTTSANGTIRNDDTITHNAPTVSAISREIDEDGALSFLKSNFTSKFTDADGDALARVRITLLPSNGSLKLSGNAVTLNQEIESANLANLTYQPSANWNGNDNFGWNGSDGSSYASNSASVNLIINAVNDAPTVAGFSKSGDNGRDITFTSSDFSSRFSDVDGDSLTKVQITSLPDNGTLTLNGSAVTVAQQISSSSLGNLLFTPKTGWSGQTSWTWKGFDGSEWSTSPATVSVTINPASNGNAPTAPTDLALLSPEEEDTGNSHNDGVTSKTSFTLTGSGTAGATITLFDGTSNKGTAVVKSNGSWVRSVSGLLDGVHTFTAKQSNANGSSAASAPLAITVDSVKPTLAVTAPLNQSTLNQLLTVKGSTSDQGSGAVQTELQIFDETSQIYLVRGAGGLEEGTAEQWNSTSPDAADSWKLPGVNSFWTMGHSYRLTVRAHDLAGNEATSTVSFGFGDAVTTRIELDQSFYTAQANQPVTISGQIVRKDGNDWNQDLSSQSVELKLTGGSDRRTLTAVTQADGSFVFDNIANLTQSDRYQVQISYSNRSLLIKPATINTDILVGAPVGYAILVQGRFIGTDGTPEGLLDHKRSTNRIYKTLLNRGFTKENIDYFSYDTATVSNPSDDYRNLVPAKPPSRDALKEAIENGLYAKLMANPAPVYLIMVDHGYQEIFYIGSDSAANQIQSADLASWLNTLDSKLKAAGAVGQQALAQQQTVILGSCYSGSFINELSRDSANNKNRLVIASATGREKSYRGEPETDGISNGEMFLSYLFQQLGSGANFNAAFDTATRLTERSSRIPPSNAAANSKEEQIAQKIIDAAGQHPLLNDDGSPYGSNELSTQSGQDGAVAATLFLGKTLSKSSNAAGEALRITTVAETVYEVGSSTPLWAKSNETAGGNSVAKAWVTIMSPDFKPDSGSAANLQGSINLPTGVMTYDTSAQQWQINSDRIPGFTGFTTPGRYQLQYSMLDSEGVAVIPVGATVYKSKSGNRAPSSVMLQTPAANGQINRVGLFNWSDAVDPDQDAVTYNLILTNQAGNAVVYRENDLKLSQARIDFKDVLPTGSYRWQVEAVDFYGGRSISSSVAITLDTQNDIPAILQGVIYSNSDYSPIADATITFNGQPIYSESNGSLQSLLPNGGGTLTIAKSGYQTRTITLNSASSGAVIQQMIGLDKASSPTTTVLAAPAGLDLAAADDSGKSTSDNVTKVSKALTLSGTGLKGATVTLLDGETVLGTVAVPSNGKWSKDINLSDGTYAIRATQKLGNNSSAASTELMITVDTTPPAAPSSPDLDAVDDNGASDSNNITSVTKGLNFGGSGEVRATVTLFADKNKNKKQDSSEKSLATVIVGEGGSWRTNDLALVIGTYSLMAFQTDVAGNIGSMSEALGLSIVKTTATKQAEGMALAWN